MLGTLDAKKRCGFAPKGDRLAVIAFNNIDYVVSVFAAASIGAVVVALNG